MRCSGEPREFRDQRPCSTEPGTPKLSTVPHRALQDSDAIVWTIERDPVLRSTITAVMLLDRAPDWDWLWAKVAQLAHDVPRFRQLIVPTLPGGGGPAWDDAEDLDLHAHLTRTTATASRDLAEILHVVERAAAAPFDRARPLWQLTLVEGLAGGGAALVIKVHHALTDGVGAMQLAARLVDLDPRAEAPATSPSAGTISRGRSTPRPRLAADVTRARLETTAGHLRLGARNAFGLFRRSLVDPTGATEAFTANLGHAASLLAPATSRRSPLFIGNGPSLQMHVLDVPLDGLRAAGKLVGGTVNDAFLTAVTGGLGAYHRRKGTTVDELRVTLPVNIRRRGDSTAGNRFTPLRFDLPVGIEDALDRMRAIKRISRERRDPAVVTVTDTLATLLNSLPAPLTATVFGGMLKGVDFVASNVPGSPVPLYLAGASVSGVCAFAPPTGAALSLTLVSYIDTCAIGVAADPDAVTDVDLLVECLQDACAEVLSLPVHLAPPAEQRPDELARSRLTALDDLFLELEEPTTPMHIGALTILDGRGLRDARGEIDLVKLRATLGARLDRLPRYRQRLQYENLVERPSWVDDGRFDIARHVVASRVAEPGGPAELLALFEQLQMQRLDRRGPLWQFVFVDGLASGEVAWIWKVHHAMIDGLAGVASVLTLLQLEASDEPPTASTWTPASPPTPLDDLADRMVEASETTRGLLRVAAAATSSVARRAASATPLLPTDADQEPFAAFLRNLPRAAPTSLNGELGEGRRYLVLDQPLADAKAVKDALGGTVNDVVLTAVTGGLHDLLTRRGETTEGVELVVGVPRASRALSDAGSLGNRVAGYFVTVPGGPMDERDRYLAIVEATTSAKETDVDRLGEHVMGVADTFPIQLVQGVAGLIPRQPFVNLVVTNVPGPQFPLYLLGSRLERAWPYVPLGANLRVGVAVLSYDGTLSFGVTGDAATAPDLGVLTQGIGRTFTALGKAAGQTRRRRAVSR
jgi:WS/DGAT/MGAT family acyltransferase